MTEETENPRLEDIELTTVMHALSDPARLHVVRVLAEEEERPCGSFALGVTKATASHHYKVLREAGITRKRVEGARHYLQLRREELDARFPGLLDAVLAAEPVGAPAR